MRDLKCWKCHDGAKPFAEQAACLYRCAEDEGEPEAADALRAMANLAGGVQNMWIWLTAGMM